MEAERMHKTMRKSAVLKGAVAGIASIALRWLTNLAVMDDSARGALVDALSEVSLDSAEPSSFTSVAAQVAGVT